MVVTGRVGCLRRLAKVVNGVTTSFLSDGDEEVAEYTGAGGLLRRYIPGPGTDQPIAMVTPVGAAHTRSYFHVNRQGSTVAMSNDAGVMAEGPYTYDAYGQGPTSAGVPFKYTGRRLDPETGLYYYRARYYSASLGRFFQTDPIGYADQMNLYGYVSNDPMNLTDPSGLAAGDPFRTERDAWYDFAKIYGPRTWVESREYNTTFYFDPRCKCFSYTEPTAGRAGHPGAHHITVPALPAPRGTTATREGHTHPLATDAGWRRQGERYFLGSDMFDASARRRSKIVVTPDGKIWLLQPGTSRTPSGWPTRGSTEVVALYPIDQEAMRRACSVWASYKPQGCGF